MSSPPTAPAAPEALLPRPAEEVSRLLALGYLDQAEKAWDRLPDPADVEALHDFRVALRRFRSLLRAFRPQLESSVGRRLRRRVRRLAEATGESRDLEVHREWVAAQSGALRPWQQTGVDWLVDRMDRRKADADRRLAGGPVRRFPRLARRLRSRLGFYPVPVTLGPPAAPLATGVVVDRVLRELADGLEHHLGAIHAIQDQAEAHAARITAKRIRYLLEPFVAELPGAGELVDRLKALQDLLGDLHDVQVFAVDLGDAMEEAAVHLARRTSRELLAWQAPVTIEAADRPADPRHGIMVVAGRLRERGQRAFRQLETEWLGESAAGFFAGLRAAAARSLEAALAGREIERKYLLSALPERAASARSQEIEQGWLPGEVLVERLRRVCDPEGERFFRTVKAGRGVSRVEIEEAATRELFEALWPLTEGRRLRKRRYRIPDGPRTWEVDRFLDRDLVLAEVELATEDEAVTLPEWLAGCLVREVTGEPEYVNRNLAR